LAETPCPCADPVTFISALGITTEGFLSGAYRVSCRSCGRLLLEREGNGKTATWDDKPEDVLA
jgi:hypothetical protein